MTTVGELKTYISNDFNVLLQGLHGTGKTQMLKQACEELGLRVKSYSASTLDPFTDLVGIPVPETTPEGKKDLVNYRPHQIDEAEVIFFDELNRAETKTLNAVFEIVQFHTINGEPLPNLKCVIGAQNPAGEDYTVMSLDPALVDRFHIVKDVSPNPDVTYLAKVLEDKNIAGALVAWWREHKKNADYVSPRRLETIGHVFKKTPTQAAIKAAMPPGGTYDHGRLYQLLKQATGNSDTEVDYSQEETAWIRNEASPYDVVNWLKKNKEHSKRSNVVKALGSQVGTPILAQKWGDVLAEFTDEDFNLFFDDSTFGPSKRSRLKKDVAKVADENPALSEAIFNYLG